MISVWQNYTELYSFINNCLRASKPSSCHLSPHFLPYAEPIFRWLPVHVRWNEREIIAFCAFLHHFLQFLKEKRSLSSFLSLLKIARLWGNEISPSPGAWGLIDLVMALPSITPVESGQKGGNSYTCRWSIEWWKASSCTMWSGIGWIFKSLWFPLVAKKFNMDILYTLQISSKILGRNYYSVTIIFSTT